MRAARQTSRCCCRRSLPKTGRVCVVVLAAAPPPGRTQLQRGDKSASRPRPGSGRSQPSLARRPPPQQEEEEEEPEVPEVGWLWAAAGGTSSSGAAVPNPSARMTVADLRQDRIKAKKSLGQNFLTDDGILREIVRAAGVRPGDLVLEVGPGTGNLTKHLLAAGACVVAVEKDDVLYARLAETYAQVPALRLVHADVLRLNLPALLQEHAAPAPAQQPQQPEQQGHLQAAHAGGGCASPQAGGSAAPPEAPGSIGASGGGGGGGGGSAAPAQRFKVVANLPYNITTDFLKATLPLGHAISDLHIMLQDEAGKRLVHSGPGDADYRAMSVRVALYSKPKYRFSIPKEKYYPAPGVDGALITFTLTPHAPRRLALPSDRGFLATVDKGFGERRKKLRNSLQPLFAAEQVEAGLVQLGLQPTARAQDLSVAQWAALYNLLHQLQLELHEARRDVVEQA